MARIDFGPRISGLRDFRNELRKVEASLPKAITAANREFASRLVPLIRARYARHFRGGRGRTAGTVRAAATQTSASIRFGGARFPHALGQEFGSDRYPQFAPWTGKGPGGRGSAGRFMYPVIREESDRLVSEYGEVLAAVAARAYPEVRR